MTFVEVLCCDVATRAVCKRYYSIDGRLHRIEVWFGNEWRDPFDLLRYVEVTT